MALNRLIDLLYPSTCILCGAQGLRGRDLCPGCEAELPWNLNACARCALPLATPTPTPAGALCGGCQRNPPVFDGCLAAFRYERAVPALVTGAKFRGSLSAARLLGQCLAARLEREQAELPDVLIPVPLHQKRLRSRGYNQALEIARSLGGAFRLPIDASGCSRAVATPPQTGLDEHERRRNIRGAFVVHRSYSGARVAILDDVVTTGSTVGELARVLRRSGAERIDVWAAARTPSS